MIPWSFFMGRAPKTFMSFDDSHVVGASGSEAASEGGSGGEGTFHENGSGEEDSGLSVRDMLA
jgi:hypothetical protein